MYAYYKGKKIANGCFFLANFMYTYILQNDFDL